MQFNQAIQFILNWEGGFVDDPNDLGKETKFGISQKQYPSLNIKELTKEKAIEIYKSDYWDKCRCDELPEFMQLAVFDTAINCGIPRAIKLLQKSIDAKVDGIIGKETIKKANTGIDPKEFISRYTINRILFYTKLDTFKYFGKGWITRTVDLLIIQMKEIEGDELELKFS